MISEQIAIRHTPQIDPTIPTAIQTTRLHPANTSPPSNLTYMQREYKTLPPAFAKTLKARKMNKKPYPITRTKQILMITKVLILEHLREPTALLWTAAAPCLMFILLRQSRSLAAPPDSLYISSAAWFYAYIAANVAFFGLGFYLIGRRESGFVRSFIYQREAIALFLTSHAVSYTLVSVVYSSFFYFISKPLYGSYSLSELLYLTATFYTSYLIFSCIGLAIAAMPIKFSTAGTLFSLLSFLMLLSGYLGTTQDELTHWSTLINPLHLSTRIITGEIPLTISFLTAFAISTAGLYATGKLFRIHPIWSRY